MRVPTTASSHKKCRRYGLTAPSAYPGRWVDDCDGRSPGLRLERSTPAPSQRPMAPVAYAGELAGSQLRVQPRYCRSIGSPCSLFASFRKTVTTGGIQQETARHRKARKSAEIMGFGKMVFQRDTFHITGGNTFASILIRRLIRIRNIAATA